MGKNFKPRNQSEHNRIVDGILKKPKLGPSTEAMGRLLQQHTGPKAQARRRAERALTPDQRIQKRSQALKQAAKRYKGKTWKEMSVPLSSRRKKK